MPIESGHKRAGPLNLDTFKTPTLMAGDVVYGTVEYQEFGGKKRCEGARATSCPRRVLGDVMCDACACNVRTVGGSRTGRELVQQYRKLRIRQAAIPFTERCVLFLWALCPLSLCPLSLSAWRMCHVFATSRAASGLCSRPLRVHVPSTATSVIRINRIDQTDESGEVTMTWVFGDDEGAFLLHAATDERSAIRRPEVHNVTVRARNVRSAAPWRATPQVTTTALAVPVHSHVRASCPPARAVHRLRKHASRRPGVHLPGDSLARDPVRHRLVHLLLPRRTACHEWHLRHPPRVYHPAVRVFTVCCVCGSAVR